MRLHWLKVLVTYVMVPSFINAIYSLKPMILMWTFLIELGLVVIAIIAMALYSKRRHSSHSRNEAFQVPRKAMVFTVGKQLNTIRFAIENQKPKFIGLICSSESADAKKMLEEELGFDEEHRICWLSTTTNCAVLYGGSGCAYQQRGHRKVRLRFS